MGNNEPESQSLSQWVQETTQRRPGVSVLQGRTSRARWAAEQAKSSVQQGRASGGRWLGRSAWNEAALWCMELGCLNSGLEPASVIPWKCCTPPFWVFLVNVLASLMPSGEFPQEPIYGWSHSAVTAVLITCADILGVSPCQMCLLC